MVGCAVASRGVVRVIVRTRARRRQRRPGPIQPRWQGVPRAAISDDAQQRDGVVGRLADLRPPTERSRRRVKRVPGDAAKLLLVTVGERAAAGERQGYPPLLEPADPDAAPVGRPRRRPASPTTWTIGTASTTRSSRASTTSSSTRSARRRPRRPTPTPAPSSRPADSAHPLPGRLPRRPLRDRAARGLGGDRQDRPPSGRRSFSTDEPLYLGMNANRCRTLQGPRARRAGTRANHHPSRHLETSQKATTQWYSVFGVRASGSSAWAAPGRPTASPGVSPNPEHVNGGVNHFGSPFNPRRSRPVYRLHPLVPDLIEYRRWDADPNLVRAQVPVVETFRGRAAGDARARARELGPVDGTAAPGGADATTTRNSSRTSSCRGSRARPARSTSPPSI